MDFNALAIISMTSVTLVLVQLNSWQWRKWGGKKQEDMTSLEASWRSRVWAAGLQRERLLQEKTFFDTLHSRYDSLHFTSSLNQQEVRGQIKSISPSCHWRPAARRKSASFEFMSEKMSPVALSAFGVFDFVVFTSGKMKMKNVTNKSELQKKKKKTLTCYDKNKVCGSDIVELLNIIITTRGHPVDDVELLHPLDQVGFNREKLSSSAGPQT